MRSARRFAVAILALGTALCLTPGPAAGKKKGPSVQELPESSRTIGGAAEQAIAAGGLAGILDANEAIALCITLAVGAGPISVELYAASALVIFHRVQPGTTEAVCGTADRVQLTCPSSAGCLGRWRVDRR